MASCALAPRGDWWRAGSATSWMHCPGRGPAWAWRSCRSQVRSSSTAPSKEGSGCGRCSVPRGAAGRAEGGGGDPRTWPGMRTRARRVTLSLVLRRAGLLGEGPVHLCLPSQGASDVWLPVPLRLLPGRAQLCFPAGRRYGRGQRAASSIPAPVPCPHALSQAKWQGTSSRTTPSSPTP